MTQRTTNTLAAAPTDAPRETAVFHICSRTTLASARKAGVYCADSLVGEGFIHLSRSQQVLPTARAYYGGVPDLVLLVVDPTLLTAPLVYEAPAPFSTATSASSSHVDARASELFPHCYGPINLDAIIDVIDLARFDGQSIHADTVA